MKLEELKITKDIASQLFGGLDENARAIENCCDVLIAYCKNGIAIRGEPENLLLAKSLIQKLTEIILQGEEVNKTTVRIVCDSISVKAAPLSGSAFAVTARGRPIKAKTIGQEEFIGAIEKNSVSFGIGPAGTGKTFLAVAAAASAYKRKLVERIILTRPAIEAGEKLGFLPGDMQQKVDPYLRPLFDALSEMFGLEGYLRLIEKGTIEVAPLAYMRGRTLSRAFIILDEAQNTTKEQMKMFLTRLGEGSKIVVNGDITQVDLPASVKSGLRYADEILQGIEGVRFCYLTSKDVVRHELVQKIVERFE